MAVESSSYLVWWPLPAPAWIIIPGAEAWFYFLVLNVLVGAIAVTSSRAELQSRRRRLCRSASSMVLDRLRSFSVHLTEDRSWYYTSPEEEDMVQVSEAVEEPVAVTVPNSLPHELVAAAAAAAMASASGSAKDIMEEAEPEEKPITESDETQVLDLQSHAVPVPESPLSQPQRTTAAAVVEATTSLVRRRPAKVACHANNAKPKRRRSQAYAEAAEGKAELNERAEQFIQQFRQELRLQRLNSILGAASRW